VLRGLDVAMAQLQVGTYATATVARFERTAEEQARGITRMRWSNAGHLPILVIQPDGSLAALTDWRGDLLLGVDSAVSRHDSVVTLDRGATVLLFTDGLIERREEPIDDAQAELLRHASRPVGPIAEYADHLLRNSASDTGDDACLVAVRVR